MYYSFSHTKRSDFTHEKVKTDETTPASSQLTISKLMRWRKFILRSPFFFGPAYYVVSLVCNKHLLSLTNCYIWDKDSAWRRFASDTQSPVVSGRVSNTVMAVLLASSRNASSFISIVETTFEFWNKSSMRFRNKANMQKTRLTSVRVRA